MPRLTPVTAIARQIAALRADYQKAKARLAEIEAVFTSIGVSPEGGVAAKTAKAARVVGKKGGRKGKRTRGKFAKTGEQSVLDFVAKAGKPNSKEVNEHWSGEGRQGKADNTLTRLVKDKKLKRIESDGERGGRYVVA